MKNFRRNLSKNYAQVLPIFFSLAENSNSSGIPKEHKEDAAEDYGNAVNAARGRSLQRWRAHRSLDDRHSIPPR